MILFDCMKCDSKLYRNISGRKYKIKNKKNSYVNIGQKTFNFRLSAILCLKHYISQRM